MAKRIVAKEHIATGIAKYGGVVDEHLKSVLQNCGMNYLPYKFKDGRIMLVYESGEFAILYASKNEVFESLIT